MAETKKSSSKGTTKKEPAMNIQKYLELHGGEIPKYHRESFKKLFKRQNLTKSQWDEKVRRSMNRTIG